MQKAAGYRGFFVLQSKHSGGGMAEDENLAALRATR
jgi:hypothetical protein